MTKLNIKQKSLPPTNPPRINKEKCKECGLCTVICPVFEKHNGQVIMANTQFCFQCGHCGSVCPSNAIEGSAAEPRRMTKAEREAMPTPETLQLLLRSRRSIRKYKSDPLKKEDLEMILEAGRYTPTGVNAQNINYIVINNPEKMAELQEMTFPVIVKFFRMVSRIASLPFAGLLMGKNQADKVKNLYAPGLKMLFERREQGEDRLFYNAPAVILVHGEKQDEALAISCPIALFNCSLMAHTLGIGCLLNSFLKTAIDQNTKIRKWVGIPKTDKCFGAMSLGYQDIKYKSLVMRKPANVKWL